VSAIVLVVLAAGAFGYWRYFAPNGPVEELSFKSADGITLVGTLYRPEQSGPVPAVVILHGSGPETRDSLGALLHANAFTRQGLAALVYDKRGTGQSEGDFEAADFPDLVADALASVAYLRARSDIDAARIGLMGNSESGWFTPEIAERDGRVAFIVNRVGPATTWDETYIYEKTNQLSEAGIDEATIERVVRLRRDIWNYYKDAVAAADPLSERRAALESALARELDAPWRKLWRIRLLPFDLAKYRRWVADIFYDPQPFLARLKTPLLVVYAGADRNVPTRESVAILEQQRATAAPIEIVVYDGYDHTLIRWSDALWGAVPRGYLDRITLWAKQQAASAPGT
jgi:dienelactone hydrolase